MFRGIGRVSTVAMRLHALRLLRVSVRQLRVGVALLRVDVVPRGRDLRQLRAGVVLPVAASAAFLFLP